MSAVPVTISRSVELEIDGEPVRVREGATILDACKARGIEIPTLCFGETLTPVNACRVCMVEVEGSRVLVPSCARRAEEGMVVRTGSDRVRHSRKMVLEFLGSSVDLSTTPNVERWSSAYGARPDWFTLGDLDFATHIRRSQLLAAGQPLSAVTAALCRRWQPGVRLLPMSDDPVETHVVLAGDGGVVHFQEWWVHLHAATPAAQIVASGAEQARPAPGVLDAIEAADVVLFPPSNPVVSIGTILAVPGIRAAVAAKTVVGVSPIIGGSPVRGMADACLAAIGVDTSAAAVAAHYGRELIDGWLVDDQDKPAADDPALAGIEVRALPLLMRDLPATTAIARAALDLALELT